MKHHVYNPTGLWSRLTINQRASIVLSIPLICVLSSIGTYVWMRQGLIAAQRLVVHTNQVLLQSRDISAELLGAEGAVRGYYISRDPNFLDTYNKANLTLPQNLTNLKDLVKDNPSQFKRVAEIERLVQQKMKGFAMGIELFNKNLKNLSTYKETLKERAKDSREITSRFSNAVEKFEDEEQRLLAMRQENYDFVSEIGTLVIWAGLIFSIFGTAISVRLFKDLAKNLRQRELNLQESRKTLQTITSNAIDGVVIINERSQIESLNIAAEQMFNYTSDQIVGQPWQILIGQDSPLITNQLSQSRGVRQSGGWFPIEISISPIDFDNRQLLIVRDITDRQRAAVQLQSRADELAKLNLTLISTNQVLTARNQELDQFAYIVSHDLKAPLRAIANLSEWLEEDLEGILPTENQTQLQLLRARVHRMYALLNGVLEYARIGRTKVEMESVSVEILLQEILDTLAPENFRVELELPLPTLIASKIRLRQVFTNLIDNAIKYHPDPNHGVLKVSVQELEDHYEFAVTDNGIGIDPRFHQKVFTIFQTLEARDTRESTGVGLAIVKKIVETEGGKIQLISDVGQGSTFYFTWRKLSLESLNPSLNLT